MLNIGDFVKIKNTNLKGIILNISSKDNNEIYTININNKKTKLTKNDIEKTKSMPINNSRQNNIYINNDYKRFIPEIMIRHQNLDMAMYNVENFVNDAINNNVKEIRIIHGRSGGILRNGVHEYLKHNKNVESFRLGNYYEGSYGVTIVKLAV